MQTDFDYKFVEIHVSQYINTWRMMIAQVYPWPKQTHLYLEPCGVQTPGASFLDKTAHVRVTCPKHTCAVIAVVWHTHQALMNECSECGKGEQRQTLKKFCTRVYCLHWWSRGLGIVLVLKQRRQWSLQSAYVKIINQCGLTVKAENSQI